MIKMMAIVRRKNGMSFEDFRRHYETRHVPLVKGLMGDNLTRYIRNYVTKEANPFDIGPGSDFDCITEFYFPDKGALERAVAAIESPENAPTVRADEARFLDTGNVQICFVEESDRIDGVDATR